MRRVRYVVAGSLDGYIAGPNGEYDWIIMDPEIDFAELFSQFDTLLMGRKTFETMATMGDSGMPGMADMTTIVFSRTLEQSAHPEVTVVSKHPEQTVASLRAKPGKDIWVFGGGLLFRSLAEAGVVDTVEVAVIPVLLGAGIPLLPSPAKRMDLVLKNHRIYKSGIVSLEYTIGAGKKFN